MMYGERERNMGQKEKREKNITIKEEKEKEESGASGHHQGHLHTCLRMTLFIRGAWEDVERKGEAVDR